MDDTFYPILTICGSMRYYDKMLEVAEYWTGEGWIVLMPFVRKGSGSTDVKMLDDMHIRKMSLSSLIVVVGSHRGESTTKEIDWALARGIEIREMNNV